MMNFKLICVISGWTHWSLQNDEQDKEFSLKSSSIQSDLKLSKKKERERERKEREKIKRERKRERERDWLKSQLKV